MIVFPVVGFSTLKVFPPIDLQNSLLMKSPVGIETSRPLMLRFWDGTVLAHLTCLNDRLWMRVKLAWRASIVTVLFDSILNNNCSRGLVCSYKRDLGKELYHHSIYYTERVRQSAMWCLASVINPVLRHRRPDNPISRGNGNKLTILNHGSGVKVYGVVV